MSHLFPSLGTPSITLHTGLHFISIDYPEDRLCVCAVVSALRVNRMMSKRRASNLIKKEIKVDVCYFQLRHSTAICQSQRCDCFGPTVIHCLSKYQSEQLVEQSIHPGEELCLRKYHTASLHLLTVKPCCMLRIDL